jgi:ribonuclease R
MPPKRAKVKTEAGFPSKDEILAFIKENEGRTSRRDIARAFGIKDAQRADLKRIIRELMDEGAIDRRKGKVEERGRLKGVMVLDIADTDPDGELLARPAKWDGSGKPPMIRLAPGHQSLRPALGVGERVLARIKADGDGYEASVIKRLGASAHEILGVLRKARDGLSIEPVDRRARGHLKVASAERMGAEPGDLVLCEVVTHREGGERRARIKDRLGSMDEPKAISLIAIHSHRLPVTFSESTLTDAETAEPVTLGKREDLRSIPFVTIDPEDARDHDDAVFAEPDPEPTNSGGFIVWVAIADVAHYVTPGSALDRAAFRRANSVYFPDRVVPMLPEALSADLCSLRAGEDRPCLAIRMSFGAHGGKRGHSLVRGLMRSAARLTYAQAQEAWDGRADDVTDPLMPTLKPLFAAYEALKTARERRAPMGLDLPEHRIAFDDAGKVADVRPRPRYETMRLIEEFMIQANIAAAEILEARRSPVLYRVHEPPDQEKLRAFKDFVEGLGFKFPLGTKVDAARFNRLIDAATGTDFEPMLHEVVLRTQSQARYSPERLGHFGLNLRSYAHFTSPIRRYADLIVHRALIRALDLGKDGLTDYELDTIAAIGDQVSTLERRALAAERDAADRYLASYLSDRIGATFWGRIAGVTRFGLFVRLDETGADGIIPIRSLGNDYFIHDEGRHALIGEVTGAMYRLGEKVEVRLLEAAPITGGLVFELLSEAQTTLPKRERKSGARAKPHKGRRAKPKGKRR